MSNKKSIIVELSLGDAVDAVAVQQMINIVKRFFLEQEIPCEVKVEEGSLYPGKGIFQLTITEHCKIKRVWLVVANSCEDAEEKFRALNVKEKKEGEPLILSGQELSVEPLEFERSVSQMW